MSIPIYKASDPGAKRLISRTDMLSDSQYTSVVRTIVDGVRTRGDEALFAYTKQFDGIELTPDTVAVTEAEIDAAYKSVPKDLLKSLRRAKDNIVAYQTRLYDIQKSGEGLSVAAHTVVAREAGLMPRRAAFGLQLSGAQCPTGYALRPMDSAGIYVPGGKAAYPSSVLMGVLPAVVAGVPYISVVTPAGKGINPLTLVAARECGANAVFKVGGAQAVAALAYGTASIPGVDMIAGPGNIFVTLAKKEVFGACGIDMLAGPSEIVIVADAAATPAWVAADLLSQAEHDENASAILLTDSEALAKAVVLALDKQLFALPRKEIAAASVTKRSGIILTENLKEAVEIA
ncbi:MAG: histidinol dehydrogenase, partial [Clostridiales bacterium]|nr:histidinol dehydrogenase [Clostridiales bacterium]